MSKDSEHVAVGIESTEGQPDKVYITTHWGSIALGAELARKLALQMIMIADFIETPEEMIMIADFIETPEEKPNVQDALPG